MACCQPVTDPWTSATRFPPSCPRPGMTSRPGLRQDILDELADHLACSYNRELLRGAKPVEARRRVIERFGDPAAVACRLWLDAMKGKIMARRMMIATCLVVTMASLSVAGVMWQADGPGPAGIRPRGGRGRPADGRPEPEGPGQSARIAEAIARDVGDRPEHEVARMEPGHIQAHRGDGRRAARGRGRGHLDRAAGSARAQVVDSGPPRWPRAPPIARASPTSGSSAPESIPSTSPGAGIRAPR